MVFKYYCHTTYVLFVRFNGQGLLLVNTTKNRIANRRKGTERSVMKRHKSISECVRERLKEREKE